MHNKKLTFWMLLYCLFLLIIPLMTLINIVFALFTGKLLWVILLPFALLNLFLLYRLIKKQNQQTVLIVQLVHLSFLLFAVLMIIFYSQANIVEYLLIAILNIICILYFRHSCYVKAIYSNKLYRGSRNIY
ncbi:hypothetical protein V757_01710 [Pelistega indica]|uniref:Uncharacterized protein n=1 Tax=Pelistega indica TaxID=1414851 RepID=V8G8J8_9BURK|nr:hypothetical protein V757_01710 [Pelistega indica]